MFTHVPSWPKIASRLNLEDWQAKLIRGLLKGKIALWATDNQYRSLDATLVTQYPTVQRWVWDCYHCPSDRDIILRLVNDIGGFWGVEVYGLEQDGRDFDFEYLNGGDAYAATLMFRGSRCWISTLVDELE